MGVKPTFEFSILVDAVGFKVGPMWVKPTFEFSISVDAVGFTRLAYDTPSNDLRFFGASFEVCAETCRRDEMCNGFGFYYPKMAVDNCFLKRLIAGTGRCVPWMYTYVKLGKVAANV